MTRAFQEPPSIERLKALLFEQVEKSENPPPEYLLTFLRDLIYQAEQPPLQKWLDGLVALEQRVTELQTQMTAIKTFGGLGP